VLQRDGYYTIRLEHYNTKLNVNKRGGLKMINKAISFATLAHQGQMRKGSNIPYIFHPLEVGYILAQITEDEEIICAGILHDTAEDAAVSLDTIKKLFSERTAKLVATQSENKALSWEERKRHTIEYLKLEATYEEKLICVADKLSNIRSTNKDFKKLGGNLWSRFNKGYEDQKWYYTSLVESLQSLGDIEEYKEFKKLVHEIFSYN
jgi:GTP diphosphokinase / guanosine-3',5'-bis(diphosphate) 3'-diphosphatase